MRRGRRKPGTEQQGSPGRGSSVRRCEGEFCASPSDAHWHIIKGNGEVVQFKFRSQNDLVMLQRVLDPAKIPRRHQRRLWIQLSALMSRRDDQGIDISKIEGMSLEEQLEMAAMLTERLCETSSSPDILALREQVARIISLAHEKLPSK